jgi:hypothetical protein
MNDKPGHVNEPPSIAALDETLGRVKLRDAFFPLLNSEWPNSAQSDEILHYTARVDLAAFAEVVKSRLRLKGHEPNPDV